MISGAVRHSPDHDDQCVLTAGGANWRITRMEGLHAIFLDRLDGPGTAVLDLSRADLDAYTARAADWLRPALEIANAEVCS